MVLKYKDNKLIDENFDWQSLFNSALRSGNVEATERLLATKHRFTLDTKYPHLGIYYNKEYITYTIVIRYN